MARKKLNVRPKYIASELWPLVVRIEDINPDPGNARVHPVDNILAFQDSLERYGQRRPAVINSKTGLLEAGEGMLQAAKALGWEYLAAIFVKDDPAAAAGFALADNRVGELAVWNLTKAAELIEQASPDGESLPGVTADFLSKVGRAMAMAGDPEILDKDPGNKAPSAGNGAEDMDLEQAALGLEDRDGIPQKRISFILDSDWHERLTSMIEEMEGALETDSAGVLIHCLTEAWSKIAAADPEEKE